ncbi:protein lethal(2)essential for life-like [Toxorhynchites rutilus septentrionalis]|uniref:protein lethal(2)essential for life-like n=1 Tax=Toxorhynchites rutilus septentrionalis TaxID=329112 RepID=UPI00247896D2|nr:protein lethal(2)essential for life-like [Toxorhynchites rutilus septentrionalis]
MPLVPILFRDWWDDCWDAPVRSSRILDQHFGSGISTDDLLTALATAAATQSAIQNRSRFGYNRPWRNASVATRSDAGSKVYVADDKFQINLDVQQFAPEEINVTANEKCITVEGKHEEKQDEHGYISRHFVRRYMLPAEHDHRDIVSSLSSDGILTITAPKKALPAGETARKIPIIKTGKPMGRLTGKGATGGSEKSAEQTE